MHVCHRISDLSSATKINLHEKCKLRQGSNGTPLRHVTEEADKSATTATKTTKRRK